MTCSINIIFSMRLIKFNNFSKIKIKIMLSMCVTLIIFLHTSYITGFFSAYYLALFRAFAKGFLSSLNIEGLSFYVTSDQLQPEWLQTICFISTSH